MTVSSEVQLSRRGFVAGGAALAAGSGLGAALVWPSQAQIKELEAAGFKKKPVHCFVCGATCGLQAMYREGVPRDEKSVVITANEEHPQRGACARGASAMWYWNHPLRLSRPLKRVGERGEGKFEPIEWDQALTEIAARLKAVVEKHGERGVSLTSHDLTEIAEYFGLALGTPNTINHAANCQTSGIVARRWLFGVPLQHHRVVDPDYENARYVLMVKRSLNASMGAHSRLAQARSRGAKVVFVDPRMSENALADSEWVPILPGTDAAFCLSLANVILSDRSFDAEFLTRYTTLPFLLKADGMPVTEADLKRKGDAALFAVWDPVKGAPSFVGVKRDAENRPTEYIADAAAQPQLDYTGELKFADGTAQPVTTGFNRLVERCAEYAPAQAAKITGVPAETLRRIAREFATLKGVCDDTWYNSHNGNDFDAVRAMVILNALVGNIDAVGGLCFASGTGVAAMSRFDRPKGEVRTALGGTWTIAETRRLDTFTYAESNGTFDAVYTAILEGKPYPVRALFVVGTTLFYRCANSERVAKALKALDLLVVQDILPHEVCDYADYVLPATYFLERDETIATKWTLHAAIQKSHAVMTPPAGSQARDDIWILMEILRRAYPERAERAGWTAADADHTQYRAGFAARMTQAQLAPALRRAAERDPDAPSKIAKDLDSKGFSIVARKRYRNSHLFARPIETPSGRMEVYALRGLLNERLRPVTDPLPKHTPVKAYKLPAAGDEFYLVSSKNLTNGSGTAVFGWPGKFIGDRSIWIHPADARRLNIGDGQTFELEGLDNGFKAKARARLTNRVKPGVLYTYAFSGGFRGKLGADRRYAFMGEGVNTHWFATAYAEPVVGAMANNVSVRVRAA
jgi:anaerobic selenocysteine-containing dehydrogenase